MVKWADGKRRCASCCQYLVMDAFKSNLKMRDGLNSWCIQCNYRATREWRARNRDRLNAQRRKPRSEWKKPVRLPVLPRSLLCQDCGTLVETKATRTVRCLECQAVATRERNRRKNCKRRGARYQRNYTLEQIATRDGWRCHLCRRKVSPSVPRTQPSGATIDHLIPICAGGGDEPDNVALAHRSCNVRRADRGTVQLRLAS